ncbi:MAG TPA: histidine kinase [Bacteroidales bacterium]|nr:histidine kinase [Bacteroidales bacterium]
MTWFRIVNLYLLFLPCFMAPAQNPDPDSLKRLLSASDLHQRVMVLNRLADYYAPVNFDSSIMYSAQAMRIGTVYGDPEGIGLARLYTGNAYYYKLDMKNALLSYLSAQKLLEECNLRDKLGDLNQQLGNVNFFIRRPEKAMPYYRKAVEYYQASGNEQSLFGAFHAMSMTFFWNEQSRDSSLFYAFKCLGNAGKRSDRVHEAIALTMIGMIYSTETSVPEKQKALLYCDSAVKIAIVTNDHVQLSINYINLGGYYDRSSPLFEVTGNLQTARYFYHKAWEACKMIGNGLYETLILDYLAEIDIEEGKYQQAEAHLKLSEKLLQEYSHSQFHTYAGDVLYPFLKVNNYFLFRREKNALYKVRFKLATAKGDYQEAVEYQRLYYQSLDSLRAVQEGQQLELLIAEAEVDKTDQKFRMLSQESELNRLRLSRSRAIFIGTSSTVVIFSLFGLLFFQRKRFRAEQRSIVMEQRLLRAQMNPHFLFNSLASIQNYIINQDTDQASIYLSRFSKLVRNILDNSTEEHVPLEKEIETIRNYLDLQKVRYAGKFDFKIDVDSKLDEENTLIPPMLAQPFIENSIEHGIKHKETNGHIDIRFRMEDGLIRFEVEDDGVGREKARDIEGTQRSKHRSMATSITRDRLEAINKKQKRKIRMEIIDLKDESGEGCGTKVTFGIPVVVR